VSLLPTLFHTAGVVYLTAAIVLGIIFAAFGALCAISRARAEARQLFLVSIAYLPLLLIAMMVDKL
jgi:protoheme IX farnesyltransferase